MGDMNNMDFVSSLQGIKMISMTLILESSALILSIVNGVILFRYYLRDKPELKVRSVYPDVYQWFFRLPSGEFQGHQTTKYGFLSYISITNKGIRDVSLDSWQLSPHHNCIQP